MLSPTMTEVIRLSDGSIEVPMCRLVLRPWRGLPLADTYGGKPIIEMDGEACFAELAILRLLQRSGWDGVWVDSYGRHFRNCLRSSGPPVALPEPAALVYRGIKTLAGGRGGCWDVFAWQGVEYRFVECKLAGKDRLRASQLRWLEAALRIGLRPESFLLVEWRLAMEMA